VRAYAFALLGTAIVACAPRPAAPARSSVIPVASTQGAGPAMPRPCTEGLGFAVDAKQAEGMRIVEMCVSGGGAESTAAVRKALQLGPDKKLTADALRRDLTAAFETGFIDQIEARARASGSGLVLFITLKDRPRITDLTFEGLVGLVQDPVFAEFPTVGAPLSIPALHGAVQKLKDEYVSSGWPDATVSHSVTDGRVTIVVVEGGRNKIGKVTFEGAQGGREVGLRKAVNLEEGTPLYENQVSRAALLASSFYYENGYMAVRIDTPKRERAADGTVALTYPITEGPIFRIGKIKVTKVDTATEKQILADLTIKSGEIFRRSELIADLHALTEKSRNNGRKLTAEPETELDAKRGVVDLTLAMREGS